MTRLIFALPVLAVALAGCATSPTGKPVLSAAAAGADLMQASNVLALAGALYASTPDPNAATLNDLTAAEGALNAAAASLSGGGTSGDLAANMALADAAMRAAIAADATVDPTGAAKLAAYRAAVLAAMRLYNADAPAAGLPPIPVPAT